MTELARQTCEACRVGAPPASEAEIAAWRPQIPDWEIVERAGVPRLERAFSFPDFLSALAFANRVGALAEEHGHHPALLIEWGRVAVSWWTHKIRNLHRNDFVMAARTDAAAGED